MDLTTKDTNGYKSWPKLKAMKPWGPLRSTEQAAVVSELEPKREWERITINSLIKARFMRKRATRWRCSLPLGGLVSRLSAVLFYLHPSDRSQTTLRPLTWPLTSFLPSPPTCPFVHVHIQWWKKKTGIWERASKRRRKTLNLQRAKSKRRRGADLWFKEKA